MEEDYPVSKPKLLRSGTREASDMTSFIEAFSFSEQEREELQRLLRQLGVSDDEGHRLLIAATEYEIALCREENPPRPPEPETPPPTEATVLSESPLAKAATTLAMLLRQTPEEQRRQITDHLSATDPLGRDYGERFLDCLPGELERLAEACTTTGPPDEVPADAVAAPPVVALPGYARQFILQMAEIFLECLEQEPTAEAGGPFQQYMARITGYGGLPFPRDSAELKEILAER